MSKRAQSIDEVPKGEHWVILTDNSHYTPADERSKTHPGHGYPASTSYYMDHEVFTSRDDWESVIKSMTKNNKKFVAYAVTPAKITTEISVE